MSWSLVARLNSIQLDFLVYLEAMTYDWGFYKSFYVLREPIYWVSSKLAYDIFKNQIVVFIFFDLIIFSLITYVAYLKNIRPYFLLLLFLFFPSVMGFLNIYRQFLATIILLIVFLISSEKYIQSKIFYFFSILTHNVSFIFLPLVYSEKGFLKIKFIFASIISIVAMILMSGTKSEMETGETSPLLFFLVLCFGMIVFLFLNKFVISKTNVELHYVNLYGLSISFFSMLFLTGAPAKRISMIALVFLLYSLYWIIEKYKRNIFIFRFVLVFLAILPSFIFSSVFNMLIYDLVQNN